jgi:hypothetical protein
LISPFGSNVICYAEYYCRASMVFVSCLLFFLFFPLLTSDHSKVFLDWQVRASVDYCGAIVSKLATGY